MSQVKGGLASLSSVSKIAKGNTRLSSSVMADLLEKDEKARKPADPHLKNDLEFERPLNRDVLNGIF